LLSIQIIRKGADESTVHLLLTADKLLRSGVRECACVNECCWAQGWGQRALATDGNEKAAYNALSAMNTADWMKLREQIESAHSLHPHPRAQEARQAMSASVYFSKIICVHDVQGVGYRGGVEPINVAPMRRKLCGPAEWESLVASSVWPFTNPHSDVDVAFKFAIDKVE
jgi:hypothetical protein